MNERSVDGTPGVLLTSSSGGTYFVPHSDLSKYRLADEAANAVPGSLRASDDHGSSVSPNVTKVTAHEVPLLHHEASGAAGFPAPESDATFPAPEADGAAFPAPESTASLAAFPAPESADDGVTSFPAPESDATFPAPESDVASFPAPESSATSFPAPESDPS